MKQVHNCKLWSWCLTGLLVIITIAGRVRSQPNDRNSTRFAFACSQYKGMSEKYLLQNLNTTLSSLRRQLSINNVSYATARSLLNGDAVWGLASCRGYVSNADCVACFDYAVNQLKSCGSANGAFVFYDDCDIRYENSNFYAASTIRGGSIQCTNVSSTQQPSEFTKVANGLLSDLRTAVPRTSTFYAASTREIGGGNVTVYAIGQCNRNLSQSDCAGCINLRYTALDGCLPGISGKSMDGGCFMKYSTTPFFRLDQRTDIAPFLGDGDSNTKAIIGGVVGGVCVLFMILAFFLWRSKSKKSSRNLLDKSTGSTVLLQGPSRYSFEVLKKATDDFSDENKIGGGVFGEVYKGTLKNGDKIAVKKTVMGGKMQIDDELKIICNVNHRHLLRLVGYCSKGPLLFLVHEYMENGSLDQYLYGDKSKNLSWKQRYEIIYGTARGLAYLHEQYHVTLIHRDIKPSNILLDNELQPKITDFGLVRLFPEDKTHLSTQSPGSLNSPYVAPEYAILGQITEKVDTYSFGIVVLEIVSGKRCYNNAKDGDSLNQNLLDDAWNLYDSGSHLKLVDDTLEPSEYGEEEAKKIIEIALRCTQTSVSDRPRMSDVVTLISDTSPDQVPSVRSTLHDDEVKIQVGDTLSSLSSNASGSTTQISGR